jgi:hypothetical protein
MNASFAEREARKGKKREVAAVVSKRGATREIPYAA